MPIIEKISFNWYRNRWSWITLNSVIALILRYLTEFDGLGGRLRHSGWR